MASTHPSFFRSRWPTRDAILGYVLMIPSVVWILGIILYPMVFNLLVSLHRMAMLEANAPFVGFANYTEILRNPEFWESLRLTCVWTFGSLMAIVPAGLGIALVLNQKFRGAAAVRTWVLLPWMFPVIVITLMWRWILDPVLGVLNFFLVETGLSVSPVSFLDASKAMGTVILVNSWRWIPFMTVMLLAALQTVPLEILEASRVDGAGAWSRFRWITLPHITPVLSVTTFMLTMWLFNMFPPIWLMTQGGPGGATLILPVKIYIEGFQVFRMSSGATLSVILLAFLALIMALYFRLSGERIGGR
jgi:multiple sugar transport system permease protein